ncbi:MAG TPA: DUF1064 domain-containing protein [Fibrella sp.]|jgi:hypothetical protein
MANGTEILTLQEYHNLRLTGKKTAPAILSVAPTPDPPKRNKYGNKASTIVEDGVEKKVDSIAEGREYQRLCLRQLAGEKFTIQRQVILHIIINRQKITYLKVDFVLHWDDGRIDYIDVKGKIKGKDQAWQIFRIKQKLLMALYGIEIKVVSKNKINAD